MRALALIPFVLLAACGDPSFDERYDRAEQDIHAKAGEFEQDLDKDAARPAGGNPAEASPEPGGSGR